MLHFGQAKLIAIAITVALGVMFAAPNLFSERMLQNVPSWLPSNQINLGLDLQGGAHLLLEVDTDAVVEERLGNLQVDVRRALRNAQENIRIQHGARVEGEVLKVYITRTDEVEQALGLVRGISSSVSGPLGMASAVAELTVEKTADQEITVKLTDAARKALVQNTLQQAIEVVRRRVDELGTREPTIQRQGDNRIIVQVPGETNPQRVKDIIGQTAKLTFQMVYSDNSNVIQDAIEGRVFRDAELLPSEDPQEPFVLVNKEVIISGEMLTNANGTFNQDGIPVVGFRFNSQGARKFARTTTDHVGERFAIVLDNRVISAPVINEPIQGGSGIISGSFTVQSANDLSILLRAGALPAPMQILEERSVGAEMGQDSISKGKAAAVIGFAAVIVFIIISYGLFGVFANISLIINITLIMGALSLLQATLTLPGIAGIVLTIGMAVDANVLIFERMREEVRTGKTPINAVEAGYSKALGTILDANITTLIAASILFFIGTGPVKGFAVTLGIGIITSVFTAFTLTRLMVSLWLQKKRPEELPI